MKWSGLNSWFSIPSLLIAKQNKTWLPNVASVIIYMRVCVCLCVSVCACVFFLSCFSILITPHIFCPCFTSISWERGGGRRRFMSGLSHAIRRFMMDSLKLGAQCSCGCRGVHKQALVPETSRSVPGYISRFLLDYPVHRVMGYVMESKCNQHDSDQVTHLVSIGL